MDKSQWESVKPVIDAALKLPREEREEFIAEHYEGNPEFKRTATRFLEHIEASGAEGFLEEPLAYYDRLLGNIDGDSEQPAEQSSLIGMTIGQYQLTEVVGYGGMATVFLAERIDGAFDHRVAFKLIRRGMDTPSNVARFKREQQIFAGLNHPNIARLYDGGITEEGLPYLVMEYIDGTPVDTYCRQKNLTLDERLELFEQVCKAVQYAHNNLVVHRDLKPANIMIASDGDVKVLDFGIAKLLDPEYTDQTIFRTVTGSYPLTLGYAAPEQLSGGPVTVATDIYALGVLFYKLLTDTHPLELKGKGINEIESIIKESTPEKPSNRADSLNGDIDAIVMKALRKEASERFNTIGELLDDLQRYREGRPVLAREGNTNYRIKKFIRRNKQRILGVAVVLLSVLGTGAYYTYQLAQERNEVRIEAEKSRETADFLTDLFESNNPAVSQGEELTARELLERGLNRIERLEASEVRAHMLTVIGKAYSSLGYSDQAIDILDRAVAENRSVHGEYAVETAEAYYQRGLAETLNYDLALPYFRKTFQIRDELLDDTSPELAFVMQKMAEAMRNVGKLDSAEYFVKRALKIHELSDSFSDSTVVSTKGILAYIYREQDKLNEARQIYLDIIDHFEKNKSPKNELTLALHYNNLAFVFSDLAVYDKTEQYLRKSLSINEKIRGSGHPTTLIVRQNLASAIYRQARSVEAIELMQQNVSHTISRFSTDHWRTAQQIENLGTTLLKLGRTAEAEKYLRESLHLYRRTLGEDHIWTAVASGRLAASLYFQNKKNEADSVFNQSYEILEAGVDRFRPFNVHQIRKIIGLYENREQSYPQQRDAYQKLIAATR